MSRGDNEMKIAGPLVEKGLQICVFGMEGSSKMVYNVFKR